MGQTKPIGRFRRSIGDSKLAVPTRKSLGNTRDTVATGFWRCSITACMLQLDDEAVRIAVAPTLGSD